MLLTWPADVTDGTVGVEEEFYLVDAATGLMVPAIEDVVAILGDAKREMAQNVIEMATPVCASNEELYDAMIDQRATLVEAVSQLGYGIVGTGTHPCTDPLDVPQTQAPRYDAVNATFPWVWREVNTCGMHVHVAVADPDRAIQVCDGLRPFLPTLLALSANSPVRRSEITGLASLRGLLLQLHPRNGIPPKFGTWNSFVEMTRTLSEGAPGDATWLWWFVRPHVINGTVEVRVSDTQSSIGNAHAVAAFTRELCLALADGELGDQDEFVDDPTGVLLDETLWNAVHRGIDGRCLIAGCDVSFGAHARRIIDVLRDRLGDDVVTVLEELIRLPEHVMQIRDLGTSDDFAGVARAAAGRTAGTTSIPEVRQPTR